MCWVFFFFSKGLFQFSAKRNSLWGGKGGDREEIEGKKSGFAINIYI